MRRLLAFLFGLLLCASAPQPLWSADAPSPVLADSDGAIFRPSAITGNLVGTTATQTLTNKTLNLTDTTSSSTGVVEKGGVRFLHNFHHPTGGGAVPTGQNLFLGEGAGNFSIGATATLTDQASYNTAGGFNSLASLTTGYGNSAFGNYAGNAITTGQGNTLLGYGAAQALTTGNHNIALGQLAAGALTTASYNVAIAPDALRSATTAANNIAIGYDALHDTTTGGTNVAVGYLAMMSNTTGFENVGIGGGAGYATSAAGVGNTTGRQNVWLGFEANGTAEDLVNTVAVGYQTRVDASNKVVLGNASVTKTVLRGNVGIGVTDAATLLHLSSTAPSIRLQDTTTSAYSMDIAVDGNVASFRDKDLGAASLLALNLANNKVLIGSTTIGASMFPKLTILANNDYPIGFQGASNGGVRAAILHTVTTNLGGLDFLVGGDNNNDASITALSLAANGRVTAKALAGNVQALSGAGAVDIVTLTTALTTTGANALTLADGAAGQLKIVTHVADGGDGTLTPTTKTGFSTIVFDAVGDSVTLQFHTTLGWLVVSNYNATVNP